MKNRFSAWMAGEGGAPVDLFFAQAEPREKTGGMLVQRWVNRVEHWRERAGDQTFRAVARILAVLACAAVTAALLLAVLQMPAFGAADSPAHNEVAQKYLDDSLKDTGALNVITAMILEYRGFDTLGESSVLFVAVCAVVLLLRHEGESDAFDDLLHEMEQPRHDVILVTVSKLFVPIIALFGFYVILNGHLGPGGGFSGGAILGAAMILFASAFGTRTARRVFSYKNCTRLVSAALLFYALGKGWSFFSGANHLDAGIPLGTPGAMLSGGLILPLNIAVGLIVAYTMYIFYILFSKGEMQ